MPDFHVYDPLEAPDVEVDGAWWPGEARMRTRHDGGRVTYDVSYRREGQTFLGGFPAARVRLDTIDRSRGRVAGRQGLPAAG